MDWTIKSTKVGCIWDCCWLWIKISEILAFCVFDPFTELFITLCIVVNVVFMALDQYDIEYDFNGGMSPGMTMMLTNGNYFFTFIFAVESFAKLAAMSPRYFFGVRVLEKRKGRCRRGPSAEQSTLNGTAAPPPPAQPSAARASLSKRGEERRREERGREEVMVALVGADMARRVGKAEKIANGEAVPMAPSGSFR